jgi:saccharopine dehydrogenase-like NADP-dependent oxidoreductase
MKAVVLGCVGAMGLHATTDLVASGCFDEIVVADADAEKARRMSEVWGLPENAVVALDASDGAALRQLMAGPPAVVVNALPMRFTLGVAEAVIDCGARAIDLSDISANLRAMHEKAVERGAVYVSGCGSSSGLTNMLAKHGSRGMAEIESVEISFASFRSIALSPASVDGVFWEFGPQVPRGYYSDGAWRQVALWDGAKEVEFPEPIGRQTVYIVPQSETHTLPRTLGAKRVTVRGAFTPKAMRLMQALTSYGVFEPESVTINGATISRRELIKQYLVQAPEANQEPVWGYALHVEVTGVVEGRRVRRTLRTTHPSSTETGWSGPDAWAKCVALPLAVGALLLATGEYAGAGVDSPETFLPSDRFLAALAQRGLRAHETEQIV